MAKRKDVPAALKYPDDPRFHMSDSLDDRGVSEIVSDSYPPLAIFWQVMANPDLFPDFVRAANSTPFSEPLFLRCKQQLSALEERGWRVISSPDYRVELARDFFVVSRQSMMGIGRSFAPISTARLRKGMNEQVSALLSAVDGLLSVHERLRRVMVVHGDCLKVMRRFNKVDKDKKKSVFCYLDPPYPHETRTSPDAYEHEMRLLKADAPKGETSHESLLEFVTSPDCQMNVMISTYENPLYSKMLKDWRCVAFDVPNNMSKASSKERKQELVYMNYPEGS